MQATHHFFTLIAASALLSACSDAPVPNVANDAVKRDTALIELSVSCDHCAIELMDSVQLGSASDAQIPLREPDLLRDARGRTYLVFHDWVNQLIMQYDSAGTLRQRIGAYGRGPGEYIMTRAALIGAGDSLFVFTAERVLQVYSPEGEFVRSASVDGFSPSAAHSSDPTRLLALRRVDFRTDAPPTYVLRLDASGQLIDSVSIFSPPNTSIQMGVEVNGEQRLFHPRIQSVVTAAPHGGFWTLGRNNYRLELYDSLGRPRRLFGVHTEEKVNPVMTVEDIEVAAQQKRKVAVPQFTAGGRTREQWLDVDSAGLLWVTRLIDAPRSDTIALQTEYRSQYEAPGEGTVPLSVKDRLRHSIIDVIDPDSGTRLATLTLPFRAVRVRAGYVGRLTEDDDGFIVTRIYTLGLLRPPLQSASSRTPP